MKAIADEVKRQSFGSAPMEIDFIEGVSVTGEAFEITGVRVTTAPVKPSAFFERSPPQGRGKMRLASVDGVTK